MKQNLKYRYAMLAIVDIYNLKITNKLIVMMNEDSVKLTAEYVPGMSWPGSESCPI